MVQLLEGIIRIELFKGLQTPQFNAGNPIINPRAAAMVKEAQARVRLYSSLVENFQAELSRAINDSELPDPLGAAGLAITVPTRKRKSLAPSLKWAYLTEYFPSLCELLVGDMAETLWSHIHKEGISYFAVKAFPLIDEPIEEKSSQLHTSHTVTLNDIAASPELIAEYRHQGHVDISADYLADLSPPSCIAYYFLLEQLQLLQESIIGPFEEYEASLISKRPGKKLKTPIKTPDGEELVLLGQKKQLRPYAAFCSTLINAMRETADQAEPHLAQEGKLGVYLPSYRRRRVDVLIEARTAYISRPSLSKLTALIEQGILGNGNPTEYVSKVVIPGPLTELSGASNLQEI
jgi:hypothetical protein